LFNIWSGGNRKFRYTWIDLTAGPTVYGPLFQGEGCVNENSFPRVHFNKHEHEMKRGILSPALLSNICDLVSKVSLHLFIPSIDRIPLARRTIKTYIQVIEIRSNFSDSEARLLNWTQIVKFIDEFPLTAKENVFVDNQTYSIAFDACDVCTIGFVASLESSKSSNYDRKNKMNILQNADRYLNSSILHSQISKFQSDIFHLLKRHNQGYGSENDAETTIFPIFVFETPYLLDDDSLAVSFSDMVLAVSPKSGDVISYLDFTCELKESIYMTSKDVSREILRAVLQTGWGIAPSYQRWCPINSRKVTDYLFSLVQTPFGPFSTEISSSYSIEDAASRNRAFADISEALHVISEVNHHLLWYRSKGGDLLESASRSIRGSFAEYQVLLEHTLRRLGKLLSVQNFEYAFPYINILSHASEAIEILTLHSARKYKTILLDVC